MLDDYPNRLQKDEWWWIAAICFFVYIVFNQVLSFEFLDWDDNLYVLENPIIKNFTVEGIKTAFATPQVVGTYSPIVLVSWMFDYAFWGLNPKGFHLTNLLIHAANCVFVYVLIRSWTEKKWVAILTSLLFGIHPMHVETVAWITSRKDLLMGFFSLVSILGYQSYQKTNSKLYFVLSLFGFVLAVLSKAVAVVLPVILVLIDLFIVDRKTGWQIILNKWLFFAVSLVAGLFAIKGQSEAKAFAETQNDILHNVVVAISSLSDYLIAVIFPIKLSALHPFPEMSAAIWLKALVAVMVLVGGFFVARKSKLALFGLTFFLVWLLPTLQFKPFGMALFAERYTYVAYIGVFLIVALVAEHFLRKSEKFKLVVSITLVWIGLLSVKTYSYASSWRDTSSLWNQVYLTYPHHYFSVFKQGTVALKKGDAEMALERFEESIVLNPNFAEGYTNRGMLLMQSGNISAALADFDKAISIDPDNTLALTNRGAALIGMNRFSEAAESLEKTLQNSDVDSTIAVYNLARISEARGDLPLAINQYQFCFERDKGNSEFRYRYARTLALQPNLNQSESLLQDGLLLETDNVDYLILLSEIQATNGQFTLALNTIQRAINVGAKVDSIYLEVLRSKLNETQEIQSKSPIRD